MKIYTIPCAVLLALGLSACEQPAQQEEPEQPDPDTEATMQRSPDTQPAQVDTMPETDPAERGTATDEGTGETAEEGDAADEPPPNR